MSATTEKIKVRVEYRIANFEGGLYLECAPDEEDEAIIDRAKERIFKHLGSRREGEETEESPAKKGEWRMHGLYKLRPESAPEDWIILSKGDTILLKSQISKWRQERGG